MVSTKMFIPKTITVGYQQRGDTYTGKLAYIIYTDDKGKLRKEPSWQSWRTNKLGRDDFDNIPTSGFVLNRGVGGARMSYGHNARNEYIRVYDPRNFEFEISVHNLLFILQECSSIKGKGLEGEFIYSWNGTELVLLPVISKEYEECVKHTERQKIKFDKKDIKEGHSYLMKNGTEVLYLGRHNYNDNSYCDDNAFCPVGMKHIFARLKKKEKGEWGWTPYIAQPGFTKIAECTSSGSLSQFPDEYDKFKKSAYCGDVKEVKLVKTPFSDNSLRYDTRFVMKEDNKYYAVSIEYDYNSGGWDYRAGRREYGFNLHKSNAEFRPELKNGTIKLPAISPKNGKSVSKSTLAKKNFYTIYVVTEKGKKLKVVQ